MCVKVIASHIGGTFLRHGVDLLYSKLCNKIPNKSTRNPQEMNFDLLFTCCGAAIYHKTDHSNEPINRTYDVGVYV